MLKRIIVILLAVAFIFSFSSIAFAEAENGIEKLSSSVPGAKYTYISSTSAFLTINSIGLASCSASIQAYSGVDSVRISAYLQKYTNGWITVKYWGENYIGTYGAMAKSWYVIKGYQYRWRVYYYAFSGNNTESTSRTVYYNYY